MKNTTGSSVQIDESKIGVIAYQMWEKAGRPDGQDWKFWFEAETQLRAAATTARATTVAQVSAAEPRKNVAQKAAIPEPASNQSYSPGLQHKVLRS